MSELGLLAPLPRLAQQQANGHERLLHLELLLVLENVRLLKEVQEIKRRYGFQQQIVAMAAHDMQNPVSAILGFAELLGRRLQDLPREQATAARIHSAAESLSALIHDLMDLAAFEYGKLRINVRVFDLAEVLREVGERMKLFAESHRVHFSLDIPERLHAFGDPARLGQVVQNLCSNAIQYTPAGGKVLLEGRRRGGRALVCVRDTGIGISPEDLPRVFDRFFRASLAERVRKAGFGLGLEICQEILRQHGGLISAWSELSRGSRFSFSVPLTR